MIIDNIDWIYSYTVALHVNQIIDTSTDSDVLFILTLLLYVMVI